MKPTFTRIAAAAVLAACALGAQAQTPPPAAPGGQPPAMHQHDGARMQQRMQERHARRMEGLKRILQITPQQEGAWAAWTSAMKPAARTPHNREEFARMTTPQRIDALKQRRAERNAAQDRRGDATKTFYGQLSAPQQKAFDEVALKVMARGGKRGGMHGGHHGRWNS
ncbi:Spy/CpxP family protein refolding chaperone [Ramlibacter sp. PS4R-6]|uniref:Spy/CpxP family protein refolding chaperone n=1 Tax=Ramlibacter sp. PS4R-6 TaxID=3133438 RepID=UPI0030A4E281